MNLITAYQTSATPFSIIEHGVKIPMDVPNYIDLSKAFQYEADTDF